jgi:hypothetical protein
MRSDMPLDYVLGCHLSSITSWATAPLWKMMSVCANFLNLFATEKIVKDDVNVPNFLNLFATENIVHEIVSALVIFY